MSVPTASRREGQGFELVYIYPENSPILTILIETTEPDEFMQVYDIEVTWVAYVKDLYIAGLFTSCESFHLKNPVQTTAQGELMKFMAGKWLDLFIKLMKFMARKWLGLFMSEIKVGLV